MDLRLADQAAQIIAGAYASYSDRFAQITRRASGRFLARDWSGMHEDAGERLDVYLRMVFRAIAEVKLLLLNQINERHAWTAIKSAYAKRVATLADRELAESFFNSVLRRILNAVGVDPHCEFTGVRSASLEGSAGTAEIAAAVPPRTETTTHLFASDSQPKSLVRQILHSYPTHSHHGDLEVDVQLAAEHICRHRPDVWQGDGMVSVEMMRAIFYRGQAAYLVGRMTTENHASPLILVLRNEKQGVYVDAVLTTQDEASIVFSFTRSYFHVETAYPRGVVNFLHAIMPKKRIAELYTAIGYNRHGKTELYRDLRRHVEESSDLLEVAAGDRGMVMIVFTLGSYDVVFKVIRDDFLPPKSVTRREVMAKYDFVFKHDRAGRLIEAAEFEHFGFDINRFSPELLEELLGSAASSVAVRGGTLALSHLYIERRVKPLNLYLRSAPADAARAAVLDYGRAIKDLAQTNIFPGDLLPKNFGVTRHGRVVFYDYDELCMLTDCNFRDIPAPQDEVDEMRGEPSFYVGPNDVFPEEFIRFLGLPDKLREVFVREHGDLLNPRFWRSVQNRIREGELIDIFPYPPEKRLRHHG